jgi:hypothetical protein
MLPLPIPQKDGSIEALGSLINVKSAQDFTLIVAWLLAALRDRGPFPVLVVTGQHGSAKSTLLQILRQLIDPNVAICARRRKTRTISTSQQHCRISCLTTTSAPFPIGSPMRWRVSQRAPPTPSGSCIPTLMRCCFVPKSQ